MAQFMSAPMPASKSDVPATVLAVNVTKGPLVLDLVPRPSAAQALAAILGSLPGPSLWLAVSMVVPPGSTPELAVHRSAFPLTLQTSSS